MRGAEAAGSAARVEAVTTLAALESLQAEWEQLWSQAPQATPFQAPQWLLPWCKHIARGELATLAVRDADAGDLVGLAPLYVHTEAATGRRRLLPIGIGTSDYLDWLARQGWEDRVIASVAQRLACVADADVLELPQLRQGSMLLGSAMPAGWHWEAVEGEPNPVVSLNATPACAALSIPQAMANNLRACRVRAARAGAVSYELADAQTLLVFLDALVRLHARRWSARGLPGVLSDAGVLAAHRQAAPLLQAAGLLRLHGLRLDGELIAVLYCLVDPAPAHRRWCYYYIGGFDPRFAALSPGTLLVAHAIEQAWAEGATSFDFLRGAEAYKYRWGAVDQPMYTLRLRRKRAADRSAWPAATA